MTFTSECYKPEAKRPDGQLPPPTEESKERKYGLYRRAGKRLLDIFLVLLAAPFVLPTVIAMALIVARDGGSPFYTQLRVGKDGRLFRMWKMRSMVVDADAQKELLLASDPAAREEWEVSQKLAKDPRITPVGHFLRKSSLDEVPQLWNVLTGDMSLVGPRPMLVEQRELYPLTSYYKLRPGLTGYWQVSERNKSSFVARALFDDAYERELSFKADVMVLIRTVNVVLKGTGC